MDLRRVLPVALLTLLASACLAPGAAQARTVSGKVVAKAIDAELSATTKVEVTKATCPKRIRVEKGRRYTCSVRFASGDRSKARLRLTNSKGGFKVTLVSFLVRHLEDQLEDVLADEDVDGKVTCPAKRKISKGDTFTCDVKADSGETGVFDVTQTGHGLARYELRK